MADFAIDDQRIQPDDPVFAVFENRAPMWEARLRRARPGLPGEMAVTLIWPDVRLDGVLVGGADIQGPDPDATYVQLLHDDL